MERKVFCNTCRDEGIIETIPETVGCPDCTKLTKVKAKLQYQMGVLDKELENSNNLDYLLSVLEEMDIRD